MLHITELLRLKSGYENAIAKGRGNSAMEEKLDKVLALIEKHDKIVAEKKAKKNRVAEAPSEESFVVESAEESEVEASDSPKPKKTSKKKD